MLHHDIGRQRRRPLMETWSDLRELMLSQYIRIKRLLTYFHTAQPYPTRASNPNMLVGRSRGFSVPNHLLEFQEPF